MNVEKENNEGGREKKWKKGEGKQGRKRTDKKRKEWMWGKKITKEEEREKERKLERKKEGRWHWETGRESKLGREKRDKKRKNKKEKRERKEKYK